MNKNDDDDDGDGTIKEKKTMKNLTCSCTRNRVFIAIGETGLNTGVFTGDMTTITNSGSGALQVALEPTP